MTDSGIQAKLDILDHTGTDLLEWTYIIAFMIGMATIVYLIANLIIKLCVLFVKELKAIFKKIKKPKFKELHLPKQKKLDNYPVEVYLNNAMRYLLVDPEYNERAISELRYAMMKGHYAIRSDVLLKLSITFPNWQFPEED
jgi:type IV secretory pathway VirB3-like protein